jgi:pantoate kinase
MKEALAYAPGHLTGLFQICDQPKDPLYKGARGAGISLSRGTFTEVQVKPSNNFEYQISINGEKTIDAQVSMTVLSKYEHLIAEPHRIEIKHLIQTPLTAGFGSSGGGALALSLAINSVFNLKLSEIEAAQIAHITEIECGTGLGSVFAALVGGFGVLYKPGAPGIGSSLSYDHSDDYSVVYLYLGPIKTKQALADPKLRERINQIGGIYVDELQKCLTPNRFMKYSRKFSEHVGLITPRLRKILDFTEKNGFLCTMAMFGEVLFSVQPKGDENRLIKVLRNIEPKPNPVICEIDRQGAKLISN